ncbi:MAG: hypothetical protein DWG74_01530 [Chloroflexi bacterium]|nr:hypothetical protein [Chloroflexota bacterium]
MLFATMLIACRSGNESGPAITATTPATATASASASASATSTAAPPTGTATGDAPATGWPPALGVPAVDTALSAFRAGNLPALIGLVRMASAACTTAAGAGGPPKCPPGAADGTVVDYLPYFECDGWGSLEGLRTRLVDDSTYALVVLGHEPPVRARITDDAVVTHTVMLARAGFGTADATADGRLLTTIAFDGESIREITGACGAYSQAAFEAGELPADGDAGRALWRRYPGQ